MPKKSLRGVMLARRKHLAAEVCLSHSLRVQQRVMMLPAFEQAEVVALYSPILNEVYTEELFHEALRQGKLIAYPRVIGARLDFVSVGSYSELSPGSFGVLEPTGTKLIPSRALDLVVVPGVAFDVEGNRLGYGKGFYDRVLCGAARPVLSVGLCFELQVVERLPVEDHDACLDILITEERAYSFTPSGRCMLEST